MFKKGFSLPLLKCVTTYEATKIFEEIHEGICGNHIGYRSNIGSQGTQSRFLLANHDSRRTKICKEVQQVSKVRTNHQLAGK